MPYAVSILDAWVVVHSLGVTLSSPVLILNIMSIR